MKITVLKDITPIVNSFNGLGLNIEVDVKRTFKRPIFLTIYMFGIIMWTIALFRYTIAYATNIDALAPGITMDVQTFLTLSKLLIFIMRRERFLRLNEAFERLALTGNQSERELWNTKNHGVLSVSKTYFVITQLTAGICVFLPIIKLIYYYVLYDELVFTLPLPGIFPYDYTLPFNFMLTILLTVLFGLFFIFTPSAVDCLFSWFVYNISSHLQILRLKLEHLLEQRSDKVKFQLDFAAFITYHTHIISLSSEVNDVYAPIIFLVVVSSSLPLCFLVYQLSYLTEPANVPFIFLMLCVIITQLIFYGFGGEQVQSECEELYTSIYMLIPWQKITPKERRLYLMPLIRSQRVLILTGYFFTANRSLLVWIFKTTGSFIAMLFALKNKTE